MDRQQTVQRTRKARVLSVLCYVFSGRVLVTLFVRATRATQKFVWCNRVRLRRWCVRHRFAPRRRRQAMASLRAACSEFPAWLPGVYEVGSSDE